MPRQIALVLFLSPLAVITTRLATRSHYLFSWDAVQFALAMDDLDLAKHQPHPPGYVLFVLAGKMLRPLVGDAATALVTWNVLAASLSLILVFLFAYHAEDENRLERGWLAWFLLLPSALFWFYGSTTGIYMSELLFTLLVAYFCFRAIQGESAFLPWAAIALAICGGFKLSAMVLLMPLCFYTLFCCARRGHRTRFVLIYLLTLSAWFLPFVLTQGIREYFDLFYQQVGDVGRQTSPIVSTFVSSILRNTRDVGYSLALGVGLSNLIVVISLLLWRRRLTLLRGRHLTFLALWTGPFLAVFLLLHIGNPGYTLPLVPSGIILLAIIFTRDLGPRARAIVTVVSLMTASAHFLVAAQLSPSSVGRGLTFGEKSWEQRILSQVNLLFFPTYSTIRTADADLESVRDEIRSVCPDSSDVVIVVEDDRLNWRKIQYYLPETVAVRPREVGRNSFMLANHRAVVVDSGPALEVEETCRTFWILPEESPWLISLRETGAVNATELPLRNLFWTQGKARAFVDDGSEIRIVSDQMLGPVPRSSTLTAVLLGSKLSQEALRLPEIEPSDQTRRE